jgi:hypothetical protein
MNESGETESPSALLLAVGADREGESRGRGISTLTFKVSPSNCGDPFILENTFLAKGGPARHLHYDQEEWFYVLEGAFQSGVPRHGIGGAAFARRVSKRTHMQHPAKRPRSAQREREARTHGKARTQAFAREGSRP